jgi:ribosomal protein S18 acetylase RimI-like enzyme
MAPQIRRMRADEWRELRRLRLEALCDTPLAFGSTYEREAAFGDSEWQRWVAEAAAGETELGVVAADGERWVAMARGSMSTRDPTDAYLLGVYVDPAWRGRGLGLAVSAEVIRWAGTRRFRRLLLHVADWNEGARRLYESLGFVATGATEPLPHDPSVTEHEMALELAKSR